MNAHELESRVAQAADDSERLAALLDLAAHQGSAFRLSARLERLREQLVALWERHERSRRSDTLPA